MLQKLAEIYGNSSQFNTSRTGLRVGQVTAPLKHIANKGIAIKGAEQQRPKQQKHPTPNWRARSV